MNSTRFWCFRRASASTSLRNSFMLFSSMLRTRRRFIALKVNSFGLTHVCALVSAFPHLGTRTLSDALSYCQVRQPDYALSHALLQGLVQEVLPGISADRLKRLFLLPLDALLLVV